MSQLFFLAAPEGPLVVRRSGREVWIARYVDDVATWGTRRGANAARLQMQGMRIPGVADVARVEVVDGDREAIRAAVVAAEAHRIAGMAEATKIRVEVASARAALSLAPYTIEGPDGSIGEVTVEQAQARLDRALVAVAHAPPEVRRWL